MSPTPGEFRFQIGYAGWVRIDDDVLPGPLYLRIRIDRGRPVITDLYLDAGEREIVPGDLREVVLSRYVAAIADRRDVLEDMTAYPGPQLSVLAAYFASTPNTRGRHDWVADSWRAQIAGSGVAQPQPPKGRPTSGSVTLDRPPAPRWHGGTLSDGFLEDVASYYRWCVATRQRPAPTIAAAMGSGTNVRTVHSWIAEARRRGILPPTTPGKAG